MLLIASLVAMFSSPVDNEVVVTKLLSAWLSSPSGVDNDLDRNFLSGDNTLAGNGERRKLGMFYYNQKRNSGFSSIVSVCISITETSDFIAYKL